MTIMTTAEIQELIRKDETRTLELKKTTGELKDAMHTACAFLNTDGGFIIFGIAPASLKILGQDVTDATRREIAQALYKMTYLENWGSGIRKIADSCREAGLEEPTYSDWKGFVSVCFKRPSYRGGQTTGQTGQTGDQTSGQTIMDAILSEIRKIPKVSSKQLSKTLSKSPTTIKKYISILKDAGRLVRIGPQTYGGKWEVID